MRCCHDFVTFAAGLLLAGGLCARATTCGGVMATAAF